MKAKSPLWDGTDDYEFSMLPGGYRYIDGSFSRIGSRGYYWTADETGSHTAYMRGMDKNLGTIITSYSCPYETTYHKDHGLSVRCVKN